ncbi:TRAP transporter small permease [Roseomonas populi]|uniref:TRAP transporter small permease protein n=1 Tax=Roseomonas populi TaxID=3121582 RepID=A0ABT1X9X9_9PROT|nr:TRAP transporter small permease [Roseomonas pecuniae]MCR0983779.1 TRAP transporter small permease [Roseomonas pecuniae]
MSAVVTSPPARAAGLRAVLLRLGDAIAAGCLALCAGALLAIVLINGANVVGRYFLSAPLEWAEELMLFLLVLIVFAGAAAVTWRNQHIRVDILLGYLPRPMRRAATLVTAAVTVALCVAIGRASLEVVSMLLLFDQRSDALEFPVWIPQGFVLAGLGLIALLTLLRLAATGLDLPESGHGEA